MYLYSYLLFNIFPHICEKYHLYLRLVSKQWMAVSRRLKPFYAEKCVDDVIYADGSEIWRVDYSWIDYLIGFTTRIEDDTSGHLIHHYGGGLVFNQLFQKQKLIYLKHLAKQGLCRYKAIKKKFREAGFQISSTIGDKILMRNLLTWTTDKQLLYESAVSAMYEGNRPKIAILLIELILAQPFVLLELNTIFLDMCQEGFIELVELFYERKGYLSEIVLDTGLSIACRNGNLYLAKLLIQYGASDFDSAIENAEQNYQDGIVYWLKQNIVKQ